MSFSLSSGLRPSRHALAVVAIMGLIAFCGLAGIADPKFGLIALPLTATVLALAWSWRRLGPVWESPAMVLSLVLTGTGVAGYLHAEALRRFGGTGGAAIELPAADRVATASLFLVSAAAVALVAALVSGPKSEIATAPIPAIGSNRVVRTMAVVIAYGVLAANLFLRGLGWLLSRPDRFSADLGTLQSLLSMASLASVVALGVALAGGGLLLRIVASFALLGFFSLYFSLASRTMALLPLLVLAGMLLGGMRRGIGWKALVATVTAILLLPVPLFMRGQSMHGLLPYGEALSRMPIGPEIWLSSANNVLYGFEVVGATAFSQAPIPWSAFLVSVDPSLGGEAGWYSVAPSLRLNFFTPYGALGEIGNRGWLFSLGFMIVLGLIMGWLQRSARALASDPILRLLHFLPIGLCLLFAVQITQYNLRSEMRLIYYAVAVQLALLWVAWWARQTRRRVTSNVRSVA